jgi:hypothetical protein
VARGEPANLPRCVYFELDAFTLDAAQALCVALPAAGVPAFLARLTGRGWAFIAPLSVVLSVVAIGAVTASADVLTWIALLLVPPGCALALGWAIHGARPWMALAIVSLLAAAFAAPDEAIGQAARLIMIVGSVATAGRLLVGLAPLLWLKSGVVAMTVIDSIFIFGQLWSEQNASFNGASPAAGLPRLQVADIGSVATDYGDYFVAGLVGAILAAERSPQAWAALATLIAAEAWNQLFAEVDSLPGTVPPCVVMLAFGAWARIQQQRAQPTAA